MNCSTFCQKNLGMAVSNGRGKKNKGKQTATSATRAPQRKVKTENVHMDERMESVSLSLKLVALT